MARSRKRADDFHLGIGPRVGRIDDTEFGFAARDEGQRIADIVGLREFRFGTREDAERFERFLGITGQWMRGWRAGFDRVQSADLLGLGLDRIAADLAAAEFVSPGGENAPLLFNGTPSSVFFVRSAIGPNVLVGLEVVRLRETDDARGRVLVRDRAPFTPAVTAQVIDSDDFEFTNPVVLVRQPFRVSFAF